MGKYLDALKGENYKTPNQGPEFTEKSNNSVFSGPTLGVSENLEGNSSVFSGRYLKHSENPKALDTAAQPTGDQVDAADQPTPANVPGLLASRAPRKWLQRLNPKSINPETRNLRPEFTELSASEISETRRQVPENTEKSNSSVFSGGYLDVSKNIHSAPTPLPTLTAQPFLEQVVAPLKVGVTELLRLGIITQQDIDDLENGMYGPEHINAYRALVEQQLTLRLAPGGKEL